VQRASLVVYAVESSHSLGRIVETMAHILSTTEKLLALVPAKGLQLKKRLSVDYCNVIDTATLDKMLTFVQALVTVNDLIPSYPLRPRVTSRGCSAGCTRSKGRVGVMASTASAPCR